MAFTSQVGHSELKGDHQICRDWCAVLLDNTRQDDRRIVVVAVDGRHSMWKSLGDLGKEVKVASGEGGGCVNYATDRRALGAPKITAKLDGDMWECGLDGHWEDETRNWGIAGNRDRLRNTEEEDDRLPRGHSPAGDGGRGGAGIGGKDSLAHFLLLVLRNVFELDGLVPRLALLGGAQPIFVLSLGFGLRSRVVLARANNVFASTPGVVAIASPAMLYLLGGGLATIRGSAVLSEGFLSLAGVGGCSSLRLARVRLGAACGRENTLIYEAASDILDLLNLVLSSLCPSQDDKQLLALIGSVKRVGGRVLGVEAAKRWHEGDDPNAG